MTEGEGGENIRGRIQGRGGAPLPPKTFTDGRHSDLPFSLLDLAHDIADDEGEEEPQQRRRRHSCDGPLPQLLPTAATDGLVLYCPLIPTLDGAVQLIAAPLSAFHCLHHLSIFLSERLPTAPAHVVADGAGVQGLFIEDDIPRFILAGGDEVSTQGRGEGDLETLPLTKGRVQRSIAREVR